MVSDVVFGYIFGELKGECMKFISNDLCDGDKFFYCYVFNGMGYDGDNILLYLVWDDVLMVIKSFVVICYDFDVLIGFGWWYWVVVNFLVDMCVLI